MTTKNYKKESELIESSKKILNSIEINGNICLIGSILINRTYFIVNIVINNNDTIFLT